jgi:AraC-like DNA-binding protein
MLGPDLEFSAPAAELVFDPDALDLSLRTPPPSPGRRDHSSDARTSIHDTARAVLRVLQASLCEEQPTARAVADRLSMNLRMMQRHLAAWGVTFEEVLDQYRYRSALGYLRAGHLSITDIAFRLGYSDSAHFSRAFRRWTGLAPRQALGLLAGQPSDPAPLHWATENLRARA